MYSETTHQITSKKIRLIIYGTCVAFLIIVARLCYLQITLNEDLLNQSRKNFLRTLMIESPRGNIIDRHGNLLATNRPLVDLYWYGSGNNKLTTGQWETLTTLETILGRSFTTDNAFMQTLSYIERLGKRTIIVSDISFEQLSKITEQLATNSNIELVTQFQRHYPHKAFASHILGYLGGLDSEHQGKMGLEKLLEENLRGQQGSIAQVVDAVGRSIDEQMIKQALTGQTIATTLDIQLQEICERVFPPDSAGTLILMNPADGAIVALLSRPNFDPSIFLSDISHDEWTELQKKKPFLNRALNAAYPPGSIFKLVTTSAALEHDIVSPDAHTTCYGYYSFRGRHYRCSNRDGHGKLTLAQSLAKSCNILFFEIGKQIDIDLVAQYAHKFGLGEKTHILFPEQTGIIPTRQWKYEVKKERFWTGEVVSAAIGQSYLLVTPLQIARMISSIFTGYLVNPRILQEEPIEKQSLTIHASTRSFLKKAMQLSVKSGTALQLSSLKNITIYAKTSTAQVSALEKRELNNSHLEHGWCAGTFAYKDHEPLTFVTLVENAGSSQVATSIIKRFLIEYRKLMDQTRAEHPEQYHAADPSLAMVDDEPEIAPATDDDALALAAIKEQQEKLNVPEDGTNSNNDPENSRIDILAESSGESPDQVEAEPTIPVSKKTSSFDKIANHVKSWFKRG
jgi:penicillin-binding protein 2